MGSNHDHLCGEGIASALCDDVVEGLIPGLVSLLYWAVTELGQRNFDVIGGAAERLVMVNISGSDIISEMGDELPETLGANRV
jgi:hypothetical protein